VYVPIVETMISTDWCSESALIVEVKLSVQNMTRNMKGERDESLHDSNKKLVLIKRLRGC
jgi:hypothetical protein